MDLLEYPDGGYGHPDHVQAHRATLAAVEAAGYAQLYTETGDPWRTKALYLVTIPRSVVLSHWQQVFGTPPDPTQALLPGVPDEYVTTTIDVRPWAGQKWKAQLAHESELERGAGPAMFAHLPDDVRAQLLGTEWYIRRELLSGDWRDDDLL